MDPINKLSRLLETLRLRQQTSSSRTTNTASTSSSPRNSKNQKRNSVSKISLDELNIRVSERLKHLSDSEINSSKATQVFVESVLVWEFGESMMHDPSFSQYSNDIQNAITSDKQLQERFNSLVKSLTEK